MRPGDSPGRCVSHPATAVAHLTCGGSEEPPADLLQHLYGDNFVIDLIKGGATLQPKRTESQASRRHGS